MQSAPSINDHDTPEKNIKFNKSQTFEIKTEEKDFKLKISYNETVFLFEVEKKAEFPKNEYANLMSFDDLKKNYGFFRQFDSTEDVVNSLSIMVKNNNIKILEEDKKMKIEITNPTNQRTFGIDVPIKEKNIRMEVDGLANYMSSLNERVTSLENKNKELENKNKELENKFKELENKYKELENKNKELEKQVKELMPIKDEYLKQLEIKNNRYFKDSSIVKLEEEDTIMTWFEKKPSKFNKLLDSKIDGDSTNAFENKCAKKCPTMVFVKTTNGYRFGGFTTVLWTNGSYGKDNKAFLFSLDIEKKNIILQMKIMLIIYVVEVLFNLEVQLYLYIIIVHQIKVIMFTLIVIPQFQQIMQLMEENIISQFQVMRFIRLNTKQ